MEVHNREELVLRRLNKFYSKPNTFERIKDIISGNSKVSLRLLDWLVTNYSKKNGVSYTTKSNPHTVDMYLAYKNHLKAYSKKMFDPFCRSERIKFNSVDTTIGQLNFFEWVLQDEVLDYILEHYDEVHKDMEDYSILATATPAGGRRKRHELSTSATKSLRHHDEKVVVSFE
jgi:hypothetical protein